MLIALVSAVVGLIGILVGGGVRAFESKLARKRDADSLLSALVAEVEALTRLVRHRKFAEGFNDLLQSAQGMIAAGQGEDAAPYMVIALQHEYFTVFEASADKLGLLHPYHADRITRFYTYAKATLENYHPLSPFQKGLSANQVAEIVENDVLLLHTLLVLGDHIASFRKIEPPVGVVDPFPPPTNGAPSQGAPELALPTSVQPTE